MRAENLTLGLVVLVGCTGASPDALPDWSAGFEEGSSTDTDVVEEDTGLLPGGVMSIRRHDPQGVTTRLSVLNAPDADARCEVTTTGDMVGYTDIDCLIDESELDLHFHGMQYSLYVGDGACEYVAWYDYMYQAWPMRYGGALSYDIDDQGVISNEVGTMLGEPFCPYDYTAGGGPNCCVGPYTVTAHNTSTGQDTTTTGEWEGEASSCYSGAAFLDPSGTFSVDGWPLGTLVYTNGEQFAHDFVFPGLSGTYRSNIPYANVYNTADHGGGMPAGLNPLDRDIDGDGILEAGAWAATPANTVLCLDHAYEILGSITISLREWNLYSEFSAEIPGDPDAGGSEPITGDPIPDIDDWQTGTPGADTYIMYAE